MTAESSVGSEPVRWSRNIDPAPSPRTVATVTDSSHGRLTTLLHWYESCRVHSSAPHPEESRLLVAAQGTRWSSEALSAAVREEPWETSATNGNGFEYGRTVIDKLVDSGVELLMLADPQRSVISATATIAAIIDIEPVAAFGWGTPGQEAQWVDDVTAVRNERHQLYKNARAPQRLLESVAPDIAVTAGFCVQAAMRRTPLLLDGEVSAAGALLAHRLCAGASAWWHPAHSTPTPGHELALQRLGLTATFPLEMTAGGLGSLLAFDALHLATRARQ